MLEGRASVLGDYRIHDGRDKRGEDGRERCKDVAKKMMYRRHDVVSGFVKGD